MDVVQAQVRAVVGVGRRMFRMLGCHEMCVHLSRGLAFCVVVCGEGNGAAFEKVA